MLISVVVCTYNRCGLLEQVMKTLTSQTLLGDQFEILVIDNNSKDNTPTVVAHIIKEKPKISIRYILETKQGLSHARNRGWNEAKGEYIAYIDDDCKAPKQWLEVAKRIIDQYSPAIFGGPYYAFYNSPKPKWFKDSYASHTLGEKSHPIGHDEFVSGGNIFFRKSLLQKIGGFDPKLGMMGNKIAYGEETALQIYARDSMPNELIYYDPELYVYHLVRPEKMSLKWILRQQFSHGRYSFLIFQNRKNGVIYTYKIYAHFVLVVVTITYNLIKTPFRDKKQFPYFENYLYERILIHILNFGGLYEQLIHNKSNH